MERDVQIELGCDAPWPLVKKVSTDGQSSFERSSYNAWCAPSLQPRGSARLPRVATSTVGAQVAIDVAGGDFDGVTLEMVTEGRRLNLGKGIVRNFAPTWTVL